jgi:hypothetical protein
MYARGTSFGEAGYPGKRLYDRYVGPHELDRDNFLLQFGSAKHSFENLYVPIEKSLVSGEEHAANIGECAIGGETPGIAFAIALVPRFNFLLENVSDGGFFWGALGKQGCSEHTEGQNGCNFQGILLSLPLELSFLDSFPKFSDQRLRRVSIERRIRIRPQQIAGTVIDKGKVEPVVVNGVRQGNIRAELILDLLILSPAMGHSREQNHDVGLGFIG